MNKDNLSLIQLAGVLVVGMFVQFIDRYPEIKDEFNNKNAVNNWDFFMVVAIAISYLELTSRKLSESESAAAEVEIQNQLKEWNKDGIAAVNDFYKFHSDTKLTDNVSDALGIWVIWNLLGRGPKPEEATACRAVGSLSMKISTDYFHGSKVY